MPNRFVKYPQTETFRVIDTITLPHNYCVTKGLISFASKRLDGNLSPDAIMDYELSKGGPTCGKPGCALLYKQHKISLVIEVAYQGELHEAPMLKEYVESCTAQALCDGVTGFTFVQREE